MSDGVTGLANLRMAMLRLAVGIIARNGGAAARVDGSLRGAPFLTGQQGQGQAIFPLKNSGAQRSK